MRENAVQLALVSVVVTALLAPLMTVLGSASVSFGLVAGYVFSTWYHARMHIRGPRGRYEEWMWRFHWHHHATDARVNFGLTNPLFDFVFRTAVVPNEVVVPERLCPNWLHEDRPGFRIKAR
jgi:sterol desaturase/sphingolipid hydroxylase (fatty acid hydroxylase superfamily)